jgi:hypothetical protein
VYIDAFLKFFILYLGACGKTGFVYKRKTFTNGHLQGRNPWETGPTGVPICDWVHCQHQGDSVGSQSLDNEARRIQPQTLKKTATI